MPQDRPPSRDRDRDDRSVSPRRSSRERERTRDKTHHRSDRDRRSHRSHRHQSYTSSRSPSRSRSRSRDRHRSRRHRERSSRHHDRPESPPPVLPFNASPLTKSAYDSHQYLFAEYLDIQKGLTIEDLSEREVKGRFKRFVSHWNRGELAKGWYDPSRKASANITHNNKAAAEDASSKFLDLISQDLGSRKKTEEEEHDDDSGSEEESSDDEIVGPLPPGHEASANKKGKKPAVTMPTLDDLDIQREELAEARLASREELRAARKADRALQKERLEDLVPRAAAGTRERQQEKKKELNAKMKSFRDKSPDMEVPEADMMGGGGTDNFKQMKAAKERKKNERELRKEAMLRQRMEEREVRLRMHREKEERTIAMLKALAESAQRGR